MPASRMEFCIHISHRLPSGFQPLPHNDKSLYRRRRRVKNGLNDESFTAYFPFYPDTQAIYIME